MLAKQFQHLKNLCCAMVQEGGDRLSTDRPQALAVDECEGSYEKSEKSLVKEGRLIDTTSVSQGPVEFEGSVGTAASQGKRRKSSLSARAQLDVKSAVRHRVISTVKAATPFTGGML